MKKIDDDTGEYLEEIQNLYKRYNNRKNMLLDSKDGPIKNTDIFSSSINISTINMIIDLAGSMLGNLENISGIFQ